MDPTTNGATLKAEKVDETSIENEHIRLEFKEVGSLIET